MFKGIFRPLLPADSSPHKRMFHYLLFSGFSKWVFIFSLMLTGTSFSNPDPKPGQLKTTDSNPPPCNCTITQGAFSAPLPFFSGTTSAVNFYSYNVPLGSCANTGLEQTETLLIMLYEDVTTSETSLIMILDLPNDGTGGNAIINFNCLPPTANIVLQDDPGELTGTTPNIVGNFSWSSCCTDGGVIAGIGCGNTFTINPNLGSGIQYFALLSGNITTPDYLYLPDIQCPITINCGGDACCVQAFEYTSSAQDASCETVANGAIDLSTTCALSPTFEWSHGPTTEDVSGLYSGNYNVTITDGYGCTERVIFDINHGPSPEPEISGPNEFCTGDTDPISLTVAGNYAAYDWSNGMSGQTIMVLTPGIMVVTVTDVNGCTGTDAHEITENPVPDPMISGPTELCQGETITIDAGPGYNAYEWSNTQTTSSADISSGGNYVVTVTNEFGCTASTDILIYEWPIPEVDITGPVGICGDETIVVTATPGFPSYMWSTQETTSEISIDQPDLYYVYVVDNNGCMGYDSVFIDPLPLPEPMITGVSTICNGGSTFLDAGSGFTDYLWNSGEDTREIEIFQAGTYTVTVTNVEGCSGVGEHTVSLGMSDLIREYRTSCNPADTGIFIQTLTNQFGCDSTHILDVNYASSDSVFLFEGTCQASEAGTFMTSGINRYGCDSITIRQVTLWPSDMVSLQNFSCLAQDTGVFVQMLTNRFGCDSIVTNHIYLLRSDTSHVTLSSCNPVDTGLVVVILQNQSGCDSTVYRYTELILADTTKIKRTSCYLNDVGITENWFMGSDGCDSLVITETRFAEGDTTLLYNYSCDYGIPDSVVTVLQNVAGCDSTVIQYHITWPADTVHLFYNTCFPGDTGTVVQLYMNSNGCDSTVFIHTLLSPQDSCLLMLFVQLDTIGCQASSGALLLEIINGTGPYDVRWENQTGNSGQLQWPQGLSENIIADLTPGVYTITVTDALNRKGVITGSISKLQDLAIDVQADLSYNGYALPCFGDKNGQVSAKVISGGKGNFTYSWSNGDQGDQIDQLSAGVYVVTISDLYGCIAVDSVEINAPEALIGLEEVKSPDCFHDGKGMIRCKAVHGGVPPYVYQLNGQMWTEYVNGSNVNPGNYTLLVTDKNGCTWNTSVTLEEIDFPSIVLDEQAIINAGDSLWIVPEFISPQGKPDTIFWEGYSCSGCEKIFVSPEGIHEYTVVLIDSLGCEARAKITVYVKEKIVIYIPNIFSPRGGNQNNRFNVYGSEHLAMIEKFDIYDRWGNEVFSEINVTPHDPSQGWNGTFHGGDVQTGVYVYALLIRLQDGSTQWHYGDVTVWR